MPSLTTLLDPYRKKVEDHLQIIISTFGEKDDLARCIAYSLQNKGKRLRPIITLMVAEALGKEDLLDAALSIELFHTASLLADDLPCMDDADLRRGHLAAHQAFNEATALLASYALIAKGYQLIHQNALLLPSSLAFYVLGTAIENVSQNTGYLGATGGQYFDLFAIEIDESLVLSVMKKKTGALFETAFLFGWLFSKKTSDLQLVKQLGMDFGVAFQMVDDLLDYEEDKACGRKMNFALCLGREEAIQRIDSLLERCAVTLESLGLATSSLLGLVQLMQHKCKEAQNLLPV